MPEDTWTFQAQIYNSANTTFYSATSNRKIAILYFFITHLPHMHYKEIKDGNFPIGSGAVESGIRRVVNLRLKGPGIFWHEEIADAMLLLRSYYKAGRWNLLKNMDFIWGWDVN